MLTIDTVVQFFPRGGSAQVIRYLAGELTDRGHLCRVICGSLGQAGDFSHASTFYQDLDVAALDYNAAAASYAAGQSAMEATDAPFHPSYEDRGTTAPDRMFTAVAPATIDHLSDAWAAHLAARRQARPDLVHVHHLSHLQTAVARAYPGIARVTTLHGTDLKLLQRAQHLTALAIQAGTSLDRLATACTHPDPQARRTALNQIMGTGISAQIREQVHAINWRLWRHADTWAASMHAYARQAGQLVVVSPSDQDEVTRLLGIPAPQVQVVANGVDTTHFAPRHLSTRQRLDLLRRWLIDDPQAWAPGQDPGSIRYKPEHLDAMLAPDGSLRPIVLWIGRYQQVKRLDVLLEAFADIIKQSTPPPILLLWGGYPGEVEGEHPTQIAGRLGIDKHVYLIGWRGHDELPDGLACADIMAAPAVNESFGMVYIEAAACGVPPIATSSGGPAALITPHGRHANGWLVRPDDSADLAATLHAALQDPAERARRAGNGLDLVRSRYAWPQVADAYQEIYQRTCH